MAGFLQDFRYAWRMLSKTPTVTLAALLALALSVGATTAIFSVVNAVLVRPLPYDRADRLVTGWESWVDRGFPQLGVLPADFLEWRKQSTAFEDLGASWRQDVTLTGADEAVRLHGARISSNLFAALHAEPALGRQFSANEERFGGPRVAILSDGLWRREFGARRDILGRQVSLDGAGYTVVGVMARGFDFPLDWSQNGLTTTAVDVWVPLAIAPGEMTNGFQVMVVGRLKDGVSAARADADVKRINRRLAESEPVRKGIGASMVPLRDVLTRDVRPAVLALAAAVALVLLMTCANVANLLLAKSAARDREIAVRAALGASRLRLVRQLLAESLVLSAAAGVLGLGLAFGATTLLARYAPPAIQRAGAIQIDLRVLVFTSLAALVSAVACSLAPIAGAFRVNLEQALRGSGRSGTPSAAQGRLRGLLVVTEMALALLLVVGSGLLLNSFFRIVSIDPGFSPRGVTLFQLALPPHRYPGVARINGFYGDLLARVRALPKVDDAAIVSSPPLASCREVFYTTEDRPSVDERQAPVATSRVVGGAYFHAMGIALKRGRLLAETDTADRPPVVVVDEALARQQWPGQDPIGKRMKEGTAARKNAWMTVVGVVANVRQYGLGATARPGMYLSYLQAPRREMTLIARGQATTASVVTAVREVVRTIDRDQPVDDVRTMDDVISASVAPRRFSVSLLAGFGVLALALAAIGVYAVLSCAVTQRAREIGIRKALGAQPAQVLALVFRQGIALTVTGLAVGCAAAAGLTRFLASQLYGVSASDPMTFGGACAILLAAAALACYVPARRANRIDPIASLRQE